MGIDFTLNEYSAPRTIEKIRILGAVLELPVPIWPIFEVNGLDWQCCLAGSSKTAPRIFNFSIAICANYSLELNSIETYAPQFFGLNNSSLCGVFA